MSSSHPSLIDQTGNRLAGETSPYLLQHVHNPVNWYPWGSDALEQARELVHTVLDQVSDRARIVLTLQELEGRSIREISGITGWSESLVKVQAFRARKEMRVAVERFLMKEKRL